jgi:hypothetical protein
MSTNGHEERDDRLRDVERITESLAKANRELLTAQVLMHERQNKFDADLDRINATLDRINANLDRLEAAQEKNAREFAETRKALDERVDKLVLAIGEYIRRLP